MNADNPFDLDNTAAYARWRERKLAAYPRDLDELRVDIRDPRRLSAGERAALLAACRRANLALYRLRDADALDKAGLHALGAQLGLKRLDHNLCAEEDGIAALQVSPGGRSQDYIPYSDRPLNWHTDGYYNTPEQQVRGVILHCARPAREGGENAYLDHEIAYILLRDADPAHIAALMRADAMRVPANLENAVELRPAQSGPVFSVHPESGALHMRYTARARHIEWKNDAATQAAVKFLADLLKRPCAFIFSYRLQAGEGVICNNILHNRSGFADGPDQAQRRLLYRARYYDRVAAA